MFGCLFGILEKKLMFSSKFKLIAVLLISSLSLVWIVDGTADNLSKSDLPYVELKSGLNLVSDGEQASKKQIPILMMFSMNHCPFCIEVEEDYLKPILRNAEYDGKVLIRKIRIDGINELRDFSGKERDPGDFSEDYNVSMVPTLVLVNSKGKILAPSIVGITNSHYYSNELDIAIDASLKHIREVAKR